MGLKELVDVNNEKLVIKHRLGNNSKINYEAEADEMRESLGDSLGDKKPILTLEGDVMRLEKTGEIVLAHPPTAKYWGLYSHMSKEAFDNYREQGKAAYLGEILEKVSEYQNRGHDIALSIEAKPTGTDADVAKRTAKAVKEVGIERAYFYSFWQKHLEAFAKGNEEAGTDLPIGLTLMGRLTKMKPSELLGSSDVYPDILVMPYMSDFVKDHEKPVIYGEVSGKEDARKIALDDNALGFYWKGENKRSISSMVKDYWGLGPENEEPFS
ncbi:hypothetical protein ACFLZZ_00815 [Nanoarchaeota archaeon]